LAGVEGQPHADLLAIVERFAGRLIGGDDQELDLAEPELALGILGIEGKHFFGGQQDRLRNERGTIGSGFDAASEQVVQSLGIETLYAQLVFESTRTDHKAPLQ